MLPFRQIWALDFEYQQGDGELPSPVCMVAKELNSGRQIQLWCDEMGPRPPFPIGDDVLFVAYAAAAEWRCFLVLGWPLPTRILDPYVEFRAITNGTNPGGASLLRALSWFGIPSMTSEEKHEMRDLVLRGGPWNQEEKHAILDYCAQDVTVMGPLLERMVPYLTNRPERLGQALLRGRYTAAVASMENVGVPIDVDTLAVLREEWPAIKRALIEPIDRHFGVYTAGQFKIDRFQSFLDRHGWAWPQTPEGRPRIDQDTFRDMSKLHPELQPLRELLYTMGQLRLERLAVGHDGRNRVSLMPFAAATSRNAPSSARFVFGPATWLRSLVKPAAGRAICYLDWSAQEIAIAAVLSGDDHLLAAISSGDPYLDFAVRAGIVPKGANRADHEHERELCKTCMLGVNYGMGPETLAYRLDCSVLAAERMLRSFGRAYPRFTEWAEEEVNRGLLFGRVESLFGWPFVVGEQVRETQLRNFPCQSNAAEMMRLAACLGTERGVAVAAPVHDAFLIEAPAESIDDAVAVMQAAMDEASSVVLEGLTIKTGVKIVTFPERYVDPRGSRMWELVVSSAVRGRGEKDLYGDVGERSGLPELSLSMCRDDSGRTPARKVAS